MKAYYSTVAVGVGIVGLLTAVAWMQSGRSTCPNGSYAPPGITPASVIECAPLPSEEEQCAEARRLADITLRSAEAQIQAILRDPRKLRFFDIDLEYIAPHLKIEDREYRRIVSKTLEDAGYEVGGGRIYRWAMDGDVSHWIVAAR